MVFYKVGVAMVALATLVGTTVFAGNEAGPSTHEGTVVRMTGNTLVMTSEQDGEHSHTVAANAKVTLDGNAAKVSDLKSGTRIRVTEGVDNGPVSRIEALDKNQEFASSHRDGKLVRISGNKLVMTCEKNREYSHTLATDAKVTLDGKACKPSDLKAGSRIRVSTDGDDASPVSRIEGLDKNLNFASL